MLLHFTKMQGAGNDFVVLDGTRAPVALTPDQARRLADRRFGVGADQILVVDRGPGGGIDFGYRIFNSSGEQVEHCGNGARCFVRYVRAKGLTTARRVRVKTLNRVLTLNELEDGRVQVDMGVPVFQAAQVPFDTQGLVPRREAGLDWWTLDLPPALQALAGKPAVEVAVASMGNPHAVQQVADVDNAPVAELGPWVEHHPRFAQRVNAGFVQTLSRSEVRLRVYERGAGETLACGTGACAVVAVGRQGGWLDSAVDVHTRGGRLSIDWPGDDAPLLMSGPAEFVFEGAIEL
jgi:diaminopimelate epimerase